jgi:hypothetical protein
MSLRLRQPDVLSIVLVWRVIGIEPTLVESTEEVTHSSTTGMLARR